MSMNFGGSLHLAIASLGNSMAARGSGNKIEVESFLPWREGLLEVLAMVPEIAHYVAQKTNTFKEDEAFPKPMRQAKIPCEVLSEDGESMVPGVRSWDESRDGPAHDKKLAAWEENKKKFKALNGALYACLCTVLGDRLRHRLMNRINNEFNLTREQSDGLGLWFMIVNECEVAAGSLATDCRQLLDNTLWDGVAPIRQLFNLLDQRMLSLQNCGVEITDAERIAWFKNCVKNHQVQVSHVYADLWSLDPTAPAYPRDYAAVKSRYITYFDALHRNLMPPPQLQGGLGFNTDRGEKRLAAHLTRTEVMSPDDQYDRQKRPRENEGLETPGAGWKSKIQCYRCERFGHQSKDCKDENCKFVRCGVCGEVGDHSTTMHPTRTADRVKRQERDSSGLTAYLRSLPPRGGKGGRGGGRSPRTPGSGRGRGEYRNKSYLTITHFGDWESSREESPAGTHVIPPNGDDEESSELQSASTEQTTTPAAREPRIPKEYVNFFGTLVRLGLWLRNVNLNGYNPTSFTYFSTTYDVPEEYRVTGSVQWHDDWIKKAHQSAWEYFKGSELPHHTFWPELERLHGVSEYGLRLFLWDFYRTVFALRSMWVKMPDDTTLVNVFKEITGAQGAGNAYFDGETIRKRYRMNTRLMRIETDLERDEELGGVVFPGVIHFKTMRGMSNSDYRVKYAQCIQRMLDALTPIHLISDDQRATLDGWIYLNQLGEQESGGSIHWMFIRTRLSRLHWVAEDAERDPHFFILHDGEILGCPMGWVKEATERLKEIRDLAHPPTGTPTYSPPDSDTEGNTVPDRVIAAQDSVDDTQEGVAHTQEETVSSPGTDQLTHLHKVQDEELFELNGHYMSGETLMMMIQRLREIDKATKPDEFPYWPPEIDDQQDINRQESSSSVFLRHHGQPTGHGGNTQPTAAARSEPPVTNDTSSVRQAATDDELEALFASIPEAPIVVPKTAKSRSKDKKKTVQPKPNVNVTIPQGKSTIVAGSQKDMTVVTERKGGSGTNAWVKPPTIMNVTGGKNAASLVTKLNASDLTGKPDDMITIDSASTNNVECCLDYVTDPVANYNPNMYVEGLGGAKWRISHTGVMNGTGRYLVVPQATAPLLSVNELLLNGNRLTFCVVGEAADRQTAVIIENTGGVKVIGYLNEYNHYVISRSQLRLLQEVTGNTSISAGQNIRSMVTMTKPRQIVELDSPGWTVQRTKSDKKNESAERKRAEDAQKKLTHAVSQQKNNQVMLEQTKSSTKGPPPPALQQTPSAIMPIKKRPVTASPTGVTVTKVQANSSTMEAKGLTAEEQKRVDKVTLLHNMYHCGDDVLIRGIIHKVIVGHDICIEDVRLWQKNYTCIVCMLGKSVRKSYRHDSPNKPAEIVGEVVHVDIWIMYDKKPNRTTPYTYYLISVDEISGYLSFHDISTKHKSSLLQTLTELQADYARYQHRIQCIQSDSEVNLKSCNVVLGLRGIELRICPPYQHEQRVERYVQTVKGKVRTILESLDYVLPITLYGELVKTIVHSYNDLPHSRNKTLSPRLMMQRKTTELDKRVMIPFGSVAVANCAGKDLNSTEPRGEFGVVLGPSNLTYGAVRFYVFNTRAIVDRSDFTLIGRHSYPDMFDWPRRVACTTDKTNEFNIFQWEDREWPGGTPQADKTEQDEVLIPEEEQVPVQEGDHLDAVSGTPDPTEAPRVTPREGVYVRPHIDAQAEAIAEVEKDGVPHSTAKSEQENLATVQEDSKRRRASVRGDTTMVVGGKRRSETLHTAETENAEHTTVDSMVPNNNKRAKNSPVVAPPANVETFRISKKDKRALKKQAKMVDRLQNTNTLAESNNTTQPGGFSSKAPSGDTVKNQEGETPKYFLRKRENGNTWSRAYVTSAHEGTRDLFIRPNSWTLVNAWQNGTSRRVAYVAKCYRLTVKQALKGERAQETGEAVREEITNMIDYQVGHYIKFVDIPYDKRCNIIHSFMFIKFKETPEGLFERVKARLVANGKWQNDKMFDLVSSSTVALSSVLLMLNIASYYHAELASYDVKGAFLNAEFGPDDVTTYLKINREVTDEWVKVDPSAKKYVDERGELLLQLDKFIYGLKQSPLKFQENLRQFFEDSGYVQCEHDECMYVKHTGKDWSILSTHVDDILQVATQKSMVDDLHQALIEKYKSITFHPDAESYIGMTIKRSTDRSKITLTQYGLVDKIVKQYGDDTMIPCNTPCHDNVFKQRDNDNEQAVDRKKYLGCVMSLMFLARLTRPDILLPTTYLATKSHIATVGDYTDAVKIVRYLNTTRDLGVTIECNSLQYHVHCDASHQVHTDSAGHTGYLVGFGKNLSYVHARSGKQKMYAQSSTDAEICAMTDCLKMVVWMRELLRELRVTELQQIVLYQDNQAVVKLTSDDGDAKRTKHMLSRLNYCRNLVQNEIVRVVKIPTEEMVADLLTKPLQGALFLNHRASLMNLEFVPWTEQERRVYMCARQNRRDSNSQKARKRRGKFVRR